VIVVVAVIMIVRQVNRWWCTTALVVADIAAIQQTCISGGSETIRIAAPFNKGLVREGSVGALEMCAIQNWCGMIVLRVKTKLGLNGR
jgi:hypothetical protein